MYYVNINESIQDILITPVGSRVMLPEYGSRIFELIDRKVDDEFRADLTAYVIEAVSRWEKRVRIKEVKLLERGEKGQMRIRLILDSGVLEVAA